jgi:hypothetical protein
VSRRVIAVVGAGVVVAALWLVVLFGNPTAPGALRLPTLNGFATASGDARARAIAWYAGRTRDSQGAAPGAPERIAKGCGIRRSTGRRTTRR